MSSMRLCIVSGGLSGSYDEGLKNFIRDSTRELSQGNVLLVISTQGNQSADESAETLKANRMFLNPSLLRAINQFGPDAVIYAPSSSATLFGFLRAKLLKSCSKGAKVVLVALQPRRYSFLARNLMPLLKPDLVLAQSQSFGDELSRLGCSVELIASGVDLSRFHPLNDKRKLDLRRKHGVQTQKFVVLHVGHINRNRNVHVFNLVQSSETQVVLVGRKSVTQDQALLQELKSGGVTILTDYIGKIEELYQLSDCYVFPVLSRDAAIDIPLSVLEAMACNLPVVSTRYGGLTSIFQEGNGFFYLNHPEELPEKVEAAKHADCVRTRSLVEPFSWHKVAEDMLEKVRSRGWTP